MSDGFYLADEKHATIKGEVIEHKNVLYFRQSRSGFDGKATKEHVKENPKLFSAFKKKFPEYQVPATWADVVIGYISVSPVPEPAPLASVDVEPSPEA